MAPSDALTNQNTCPHCHQPITPGVKFCESCGTKIEPSLSCPGCGSSLTPGVKFCESCGKPVAAPVTAPVSVSTPLVSAEPESPVPKEEPAVTKAPGSRPAASKPVAPKTAAPAGSGLSQKNLIIAGVVGLVVIAAIAFFVVLPLLSGGGGTGNSPFAGGSAGTATAASGTTASATQSSETASFTVKPTSQIPENYKVTYQAERNGINGLVTVTFAGGPGINGVRETTIRLTKSDGTVETKSWKPKQNGDSATVQGTLMTDHLEVIANFYNGDSYRVIDQIFEYKKKN